MCREFQLFDGCFKDFPIWKVYMNMLKLTFISGLTIILAHDHNI